MFCSDVFQRLRNFWTIDPLQSASRWVPMEERCDNNGLVNDNMNNIRKEGVDRGGWIGGRSSV